MRSVRDRCSIPIPTNPALSLWTWNVEGLRETAKYDSIISFCRSKNVSLLCAQENKVESSHYFNKNGWEILMSGLPAEKHHGVGFFVSPWLRSHVCDFIPHSPRIAEITVNTLPHKNIILNVYAPSLVEDPDNDRDRKLKFRSHLGHIVLSHSNQSHLLILGDFNARLDAKIDPVQNHIGPQVIGARASINDDDRDNAILLFELLQSHNLTLPQTYSSRKLVSYKETTCSDHLLNGEDVKDWAALDDLLCPISLQNTLSFQGSLFQQAINSRHLPLSFHLRTRYLPIAKQIQPPKQDYRSMAQFFTAVDSGKIALDCYRDFIYRSDHFLS